jgi:hypothetical protein
MEIKHRISSQARVIANMDDLNEAIRWRSILQTQQPLEFHLPGLSPDQLTFWQSTINRLITACGCVEGAMGGATFLGIFLLYLETEVPSLNRWDQVGIGFGLFCGGLLIGKLIGMLRARILLRQSMQRLSAVLSEAR